MALDFYLPPEIQPILSGKIVISPVCRKIFAIFRNRKQAKMRLYPPNPDWFPARDSAAVPGPGTTSTDQLNG
jgi:hypothetical protein